MKRFALSPISDTHAALIVLDLDDPETIIHEVLTMPHSVAQELQNRGRVARQEDCIRGIGYPGVIVNRRPLSNPSIEVRADCADPTTVISEALLNEAIADQCVGRDPFIIRWMSEHQK